MINCKIQILIYIFFCLKAPGSKQVKSTTKITSCDSSVRYLGQYKTTKHDLNKNRIYLFLKVRKCQIYIDYKSYFLLEEKIFNNCCYLPQAML